MKIDLPNQLEEYITDLIECGEYKSASTVIDDALRLHMLLSQKSIDGIRRAIAKGWDGRNSDKTVSDIIKLEQGAR